MDSEEVRRVRCLERIKQILKEENCILEAGIQIVGSRIVDSQVFVIALSTPKEGATTKEETKLTAEVPIVEQSAQKEGVN